MVDRRPERLPALVNRRVVAFVRRLAFHRASQIYPSLANWTELTAAIREEDICINPEPSFIGQILTVFRRGAAWSKEEWCRTTDPNVWAYSIDNGPWKTINGIYVPRHVLSSWRKL